MRHLIILILSVFSGQIFAQITEGKMLNAQPGKCYEICYIPSVWKIDQLNIPVYIGSNDDEIIEREAQFFTDEDGKERRVLVVLDHSKTDFYTIKQIRKRRILRKGDYEEWREVFCPDEMTSSMIHQIKEKLIAGNFLPPGYIASEDYEPEFKNALISFQKKNYLPIGHFDFETLEALGIDYEN